MTDEPIILEKLDDRPKLPTVLWEQEYAADFDAPEDAELVKLAKALKKTKDDKETSRMRKVVEYVSLSYIAAAR